MIAEARSYIQIDKDQITTTNNNQELKSVLDEFCCFTTGI